jgi:two-component system, chemotaxis family, protein-glutamate methylesterase/glutaminase
MLQKTRVLVIDDSALTRQVLGFLIERDRRLEVVGKASDGLSAWESLKELSPDVVTLDVEMPHMDGLTFLAKMMKSHPVRTIMVSSASERGRESTLRALELGAIDYVTKPALDARAHLGDFAKELSAKIRMAAGARLRLPARLHDSSSLKPPPSLAVAAVSTETSERVVVMGASTGGTEALREVLRSLPADAPGVAVVQHMPEAFTRTFAERLDRICEVTVREARNGEPLVPGLVLIAPGNKHIRIRRVARRYFVEVLDGAPVNGFRPSVDVLFKSCARQAGKNGVGVLMTGMGDDGARGLFEMREAGGRTIVQDQASCLVFGMPREAIERGAAEVIVPLDKIADAVMRSVV